MQTRFIRIAAVAALLLSGTGIQARVVKIAVPDPATWKNDALAACAYGDTVQFDVPILVNRNYNTTGLRMSVRRIFSPTNQALPLSEEYKQLLALNGKAAFSLTGCGYHRNGERLHNLKARVSGRLELEYISGTWEGNNTRSAIEYKVPSVDMKGQHNVLVCGANLEYYLVENIGTGYGADSYYEHQKQRKKVLTALSRIHADVYGLVEVEQGQSALA